LNRQKAGIVRILTLLTASLLPFLTYATVAQEPSKTPPDRVTLVYAQWGIEISAKSMGCRRNLLKRMNCRIIMEKTKGPKLPGQLLLVNKPSVGRMDENGIEINDGMPARAKAENAGWIETYDVRATIPRDGSKQRIENGRPFTVEIHFKYAPKGSKLDRLNLETAIFMHDARKTVAFADVPIVDIRTTGN
jgi:hypothetical protein